MATRNIYQKACPSCATLIEVDVKQCSCGYRFGVQQGEDELLPEDVAAQEEELVKEYLDARVGQAVTQLQVSQAALANDPKNIKTANSVMRAFSEMRELRAELDAQTAKIAEARRIARAARIERGLNVEPSTEPADTAATSPQPTEEFRVAQSAKVEKIMRAAGMGTKECPKCHSVMPERAALCFCGYGFRNRNESGARPSEIPTVTVEAAPRKAV